MRFYLHRRGNSPRWAPRIVATRDCVNVPTLAVTFAYWTALCRWPA